MGRDMNGIYDWKVACACINCEQFRINLGIGIVSYEQKKWVVTLTAYNRFWAVTR